MKYRLKNKIYAYILAFFALTTLCILVISIKADRSREKTVLTTQKAESYIIKEYKEKIAVFETGDRVPTEILDVYLSTLPSRDQVRIRAGIRVSGKAALRRMIEDYTS